MRDLIEEGRRMLREYVSQSVGKIGGWRAAAQGVTGVNPQQGVIQSYWTDPSYPMRTRAAKEILELIRDLSVEHTEKTPDELISMAIAASPYQPSDMTDEDRQLLRMAIDHIQNGPAVGATDGRQNTAMPFAVIAPVESDRAVNRLTEMIPYQGFHSAGSLPPNPGLDRYDVEQPEVSVLSPQEEQERWQNLVQTIGALADAAGVTLSRDPRQGKQL